MRVTGNSHDASRDIDEILRINPHHVDALYCRAQIYDFQGRGEKAIAAYSQVILVDANNSNAYSARGFLLLEQANCVSALAVFQHVFTSHP